MYIPQIEGQQDTKENVSFGMSIASQGKWDQFVGNSYVGSRLDTTVGALSLNNQMATTGLIKKDSVPLSQEDWKNSEWYRDKLSYSSGMTSYRASIMSKNYDKVQYQNYMNSQSKGLGRGILKFTGRLTGQLVDPINYIPFLGTGAKVLKMTPATFTRKLALHPFTQPFLTSKALRGATEGFISSSLVQPFMNESAKQMGEARTFGQGLADVMFGTVFSGALSSIIPSNYDYFKSEYGNIIKQTSDLYSKKFDTFEKLKLISEIENIDSQLKYFKGKPTVSPTNIPKFIKDKKDSLAKLEIDILDKSKLLSTLTDKNLVNYTTIPDLLKKKDLNEKRILQIKQTSNPLKLKQTAIDVKRLRQENIDIDKSINIMPKEKRNATYSDITKLKDEISYLKQQKKIIESKKSTSGTSYENHISKLSREKSLALQKLGTNDTKNLLKSLRSENKLIDESIDTLTKDMTSFPQSTQINSTKALSSAVDSIIDGRMADVGEGGLSAISDMMKKYGIKEIPIAKRLAEFEPDIELNQIGKKISGTTKESIPKREDTVISEKELSLLEQNDMVELQRIDSDIAISQKIDEIMTQANNCLMGRI